MNKFFTRIFSLLLFCCWGFTYVIGQTNPTPISTFPYTQNFNGISAYPVGWQGWDIGGSLSTTVTTAVPSGDRVFTASVLNSSNANSVGLYNSDRLGLLSTGSAIRAIAFALNTTGHTGIQIKYNVATQRSPGRIGSFYLQYRVGASGTFTTISSSVYENTGTTNTGNNGNFIDSTTITVTLPSACENKAIVQLRWVMCDKSGSGDRPGFSIDNVQVTVAPTSCTAPTSTVSDFITNSVPSTNSIDLEWTNGNGAGRVVYINSSNSFTDPSAGADPTANTTYSGGQQVIYNGTGSSPITVDNLLPNTTYYFKGYEYCSPDRVYNNSGVVENITTDVGSNIILTESSTYGPFCSGNNQIINVAFDKVGTFNGEFKVQISDANGIFSTNTSVNIIGTGSASPITATIPMSTLAGSGYRVRVINADPITFGDNNGSNIVINTIPTIPTSTVPSPVCEGNSISVTASGSTNALSYTFWDAATGGNQVTTGVSGNTLTLDNNTPAGSYTYYIQAENGTCVSERQEVTLEVIEQPDMPVGAFTYSNNTSCGPVTVSFDEGYYFQYSSNGTSTSLPTSSSLTLNESGKVYARAFNGSCWSDAVESDFIEIFQPVSITTQPTNVSIPSNGSGQLSVIANHVSSYQWQINDGCGWTDIIGATSNSYVINNPSLDMSNITYRVLLTGNGICPNIYSQAAALTVTEGVNSIWKNDLDGTLNSNAAVTSGHIYDANYLSSPSLSSYGITTASYSGRYGGSNWSTTSSVNTNKYLQLSISVQAGESVDFDTLVATFQSSGTGPTQFQVRSSLDSYSSTIYTSSHTGTTTYDIPLNKKNVTGTFTIRIYGYNAGANTGTFSINDFDLKGNRVETCTPPTITQQPNAISPCYKTMSVETSSPSATYQWEIKTPSSTQYERILSCTPNTIGGQTSQLEIIGTIPVGTKYRVKVTADNCTAISDSIEYTGNASVSLSNEIGDIILDADPCDANGWTYYSSASNPGQYLFAINWAPSGTISASNQNAKDVAQVKISLNNDFFSNEDVINGDYFATYTMRRYWNVDASSFDEPVNVIFPYLNSEIQEIVDAAQTYASNQVGSRYEGFKWFKIEGQSFEPISSIVTPVNIINSIPLTDVASTSNNITYAQFNGITSFSGGTGATGVGPLINDPLPVELLYFNASCQNSSLTLDWATASEKNADKFIVEGSNDGIAFENIGSVLAYGNSNSLKEYEYKVNEPKHKYYRLLQIDFDGTQEYFKIVSAPCDLSQNMIAARYASNEGIIVEIQSSKNKEMTLTLTSTNGQNILNQKIDVQAGSQRLVLSTEKLPKGIYIISVGNAYQQQTSKLSVY